MLLPDDASCRVVTCDPPLSDDALPEALGKLFAQFVREQRCDAWSCMREHAGAALVLAWTPDVALSGCSHDKINGVLASHERDGRRLLAPPPMCIRTDDGWRCVDRAGLRRLATAATAMLDHRLERLGDWRTRGLTTVGASWAAALLSGAVRA